MVRSSGRIADNSRLPMPGPEASPRVDPDSAGVLPTGRHFSLKILHLA